MEVDPVRNSSLQINFDVTFPDMPCAGELLHRRLLAVVRARHEASCRCWTPPFIVIDSDSRSPLVTRLAVVSLDAMDASGSHQLEVMHDVVKRRLDSSGRLLSTETNVARGTVKDSAALLKEKARAQLEGRKSGPTDGANGTVVGDGVASLCETCYGAEEKAGDCCNSCEAVRDAYRCVACVWCVEVTRYVM